MQSSYTLREKQTLFVSGPTASGKTGFSLALAQNLTNRFGLESEIINADIGQFYKPLSIGTAKPNWQVEPLPHHLFDILDKPTDCNVVTYKKLLLDKVEEVWRRGKLPIIVGGSLFYIQSLFFSPIDAVGSKPEGPVSKISNPEALWKELHAIDPERAAVIEPQDGYRIARALEIWEKTGIKPSLYKPPFDPEFHAYIIFIDLPRSVLYDRINLRTQEMITEGWVDEVRRLQGTPWEDFLKRKKLIGYPEIFAWLEGGENRDQLGSLVESVRVKTRNYAKRQVTFWKKFRKILMDSYELGGGDFACEVQTIVRENAVIKSIIEDTVERVGMFCLKDKE